MELSVTQFVTIDGVYQAPGGPEEDPSGGFAHGGWSAPFGDDAFGEFMVSVFDRVDAFLLGRRTYEIFASYWPKNNPPGHPIANKLNDLPKYVPTSTLDTADWSGTELLRGDLVKEVTDLKARPGRELQVHGSGALIHSLLAANLVDTLNILTFPVILGTGKRLFPENAHPTAFTVTETRVTPKGVVIATYRKQGDPTYGTVGAD
ncbi:dihydrofolate reductase family protein [Nocardia sp. CDC160]|uniref:dihydrofolate reductase family protein n=1 Tax=Nocardia sp. CDC160 TaxID=3112166 RepID=UPI002DBF253B|nr:dihydrofolate reductase family protein [Nocardia sp. CDC160]MEC3915405.1 dihydrofolate reductase family protein [Nocardia sp. CDC160]